MKSKYIISMVGTVWLTAWLVACGDGVSNITPDQDRAGTPITLTVYWAQTDAELREYWQQRTGNPASQAPNQWGFAQWNQNAPVGEYWCDVFVLQPRGANDRRMDSLGHEVAHCVWGSWHP
jgi:hypothetical protein